MIAIDQHSCDRCILAKDGECPEQNSVHVINCWLPKDPFAWSPCHVKWWVYVMSRLYSLSVALPMFEMNGRGLCLLSLPGFMYREQTGKGYLLYYDLRYRLWKKFHKEEEH
ncbi:G-protein coupled receptor [Branchiostoma belcheri]|nr:G-protein coupled receptor [Branchiostoma belcheri]